MERTQESPAPSSSDIAAASLDTLRQIEIGQQLMLAHIGTIQQLIENYGLDVRALVALHGDSVIDGTQKESRALLDAWGRLYGSLVNENSVTVLSIERRTQDAVRRMTPIRKQFMPETFVKV